MMIVTSSLPRILNFSAKQPLRHQATDHTGNFSSWEIEETITTNIDEAGEQTETNTDNDSWDPDNYPSGGYQTNQHPSEYQVEIQLNGPDGPVTKTESADVPENAPC